MRYVLNVHRMTIYTIIHLYHATKNVTLSERTNLRVYGASFDK